MAWLYVPELAGLNSDCTLCTETPIKLDVGWNGKPIRPRVLSREWKKGSYLKLLCGPTLRPSMADHLMEKYTSSLADIRVSLSVARENRKRKKTRDTYGRTSFESLRKLILPSSSLKTLLTTSQSDLLRYAKAYERWATALKRAYSQRKSWDSHTSAKDSSSWPTPTKSMTTGEGTQGREGGMNLQTRATRWATPTISGNYNNAKLSYKAGDGLATQSKRWATPIARDWKDGTNPSSEVPTNSLLGRQAPRTNVLGEKSSKNSPSSLRQLNPIFVEWLMGFPMRWSLPDTAPTDYEALEMQYLHWSQLMRSILYLMRAANHERDAS